jgi:hypothetical protein
MMKKLFKACLQGLLLAACFVGGYYWGNDLKDEVEANAKALAVAQINDTIKQNVTEVAERVDSALERAKPSPVEPISEVQAEVVSEEVEREEAERSALSLAMENNLQALKNLGQR